MSYVPLVIVGVVGFRGRVSAVGVDLGTTFSVVAVNHGDGKVQVIPGLNSSDPLLPSVVSYLSGGQVAVGHEAIRHLQSNPSNTVYGAKRFIGKDSVAGGEEYSALGLDHLTVVQKDGDISSTWFSIKAQGHPEAVSPQAVGSEVVKSLKKMAASFLGHEMVDKAVIAVPAKFSPRQVEATVQAFAAAGLKVIRVLEEPTAAAMAYGLHKQADVHHVLVYDFGGGTLDVSMLFMNEGSIEVLASEGDESLGGSDIDQCLARVLEEKLGERKVAPEHAAAAETAGCVFEEAICVGHMMGSVAEGVKKALTDAPQAELRCMTLPPSENKIKVTSASSCGSWVSVQEQVTKAEFEGGCDSLWTRALVPVDRLLRNLDMDASEVDEVVCVGGTTRVPRVREQLKAHLGAKQLNTHIDPDITVAWGAATIAH